MDFMNLEAKKWMNLVGLLWIQVFTGTNFDFSAYSTTLKQVLQISQVQLNNLAVASDLGKVFGWISGYAMRRMPLWSVLLTATSMGLVGYGLQWFIITERLSSNYWQVYLLCLLAGNSICWFNTIGFVLCIQNFATRKAMALGISTSYNALTAAVFALIVNAIVLSSETIYLLLNALIPLIICSIVLTFIQEIPSRENSIDERAIFIILNIIAMALGVYLLPIDFFSFNSTLSYKLYAIGMVLLLLAPLCIPATVHVCTSREKNDNNSRIQGYYSRIPDDNDNGGLDNGFHSRGEDTDLQENERALVREASEDCSGQSSIRLNWAQPVPALGEEHNIFQLLRSVDFWLYFFMYLFGASLGLTYSNNLGQISESRGFSSSTIFVSLYSSSGFFGRLLSAAPDYSPRGVNVGRPGWMCLALIPMPPSFFYLATTDSAASLYLSTAIIGLCTGFIIATSVSTTPELFGTNSFGVNHNILVANIPLGTLLFGYMAALIYDYNAQKMDLEDKLGIMVVCMGVKCYRLTFIIWGCICVVALILNCILLIRSRRLYKN
ncbi:protein NUCLEAR FUSION DEFECTIVE 4 [Cryptomeria japonica]|uniref:protein NUCLEAR FUSION DEFECTIVE 4 n=1 Tax=Cryptomeria japonica TaxID=3369 RepID=UPI0025AD628C|nr:protein NUCLEAR FUSION DEFECTIVE 4 [Cryptomeria japonica]